MADPIDVDALEKEIDFWWNVTLKDDPDVDARSIIERAVAALRQQQGEIENLIEDLKSQMQIANAEANGVTQLSAEVARLRAVIEEAPHQALCGAMDPDDLVVCSCWKRKALEGPK